MKRFAAVLVVVGLAGCGSGSELARPRLDMGLLSPDGAAQETGFRGPGVGIEKPSGETKITEEHILEALREMGPIDGPIRVALVEIRAQNGGYEPVSVEPAHLEAFRASLGTVVDSVQTIPQMFLPARADLPAIRYAAARIGANAVFLFGRGTETDTYYNAWSNLNWLVLPIFVVPGKTVEVYAASEGALVDVRTSRVRAVSVADSRLTSDLTTAARSWRTRKELTEEAGLDSMRLLGENLAKEVGALKVGHK